MQEERSCDLKLLINGERSFFLNQKILTTFSGRMRKMTRQERIRGRAPTGVDEMKMVDFPGEADGFELVARFCYNNGRIAMNPSNICVLHCSAVFMEMTEELVPCNLLTQAETFLDGLFYWTWDEILTSVKTCENFFQNAESSGLLQRLLPSLLAKISANSEASLLTNSTFLGYSSSSSPDTSHFGFSNTPKTHDAMRPCKEWWFDDLTNLHPNIITKIMTSLNAYGSDNKNLILTRFLLHYLNKVSHSGYQSKQIYSGLADTVVHGVVLMGRKAFSCRGLFWVLRVVTGLGISKNCKQKLESLMGQMLDYATLDDLLVSGHGAVYDVNLVLRLVKIFVEGAVTLPRMKKMGNLLDKYLGEISPDQNLKVDKFLKLTKSLPDSARSCFDGVYRAMDIYLESHPALSLEDRSRLCRCLNYEKLTCEACRDLAKNPRIPPRAAVQALLVSQHTQARPQPLGFPWPTETQRKAVYYKGPVMEKVVLPSPSSDFPNSKEDLRLNWLKTKLKVAELENVCKDMKDKMSMMAKSNVIDIESNRRHNHHHKVHNASKLSLPRLC